MENWVDKVKGFGRDPTDLPKAIYYLSHKLLAAKLHTCGFEVVTLTAQKIKLSDKDFFSKCDQTHSFLRIWSHLLKKSLIENFIFCDFKTYWKWPIKQKIKDQNQFNV